MHQPVRDRGGERPAHGEAAPSLGFDTQVPDSIRKLYLLHEYLQQPFNFSLCYICPMTADYMYPSVANFAANLATASRF